MIFFRIELTVHKLAHQQIITFLSRKLFAVYPSKVWVTLTPVIILTCRTEFIPCVHIRKSRHNHFERCDLHYEILNQYINNPIHLSIILTNSLAIMTIKSVWWISHPTMYESAIESDDSKIRGQYKWNNTLLIVRCNLNFPVTFGMIGWPNCFVSVSPCFSYVCFYKVSPFHIDV